MKIEYVAVACLCVLPMLCRDKQCKHLLPSNPGMVNDDPILHREIGQAARKAEDLLYVYRAKVWQAENEKEIDQAEEFYDQQVVPAEIERLKKESLKHSFYYRLGLGF